MRKPVTVRRGIALTFFSILFIPIVVGVVVIAVINAVFAGLLAAVQGLRDEFRDFKTYIINKASSRDLGCDDIRALETMTECTALWLPEHIPAQETIGLDDDVVTARAAIERLKALDSKQ